jgi:hypothetical protein
MGGKALVLRGGRQLFFGPAQELQRQGILEEAFDHRFIRLRHPRGGELVLPAEE